MRAIVGDRCRDRRPRILCIETRQGVVPALHESDFSQRACPPGVRRDPPPAPPPAMQPQVIWDVIVRIVNKCPSGGEGWR